MATLPFLLGGGPASGTHGSIFPSFELVCTVVLGMTVHISSGCSAVRTFRIRLLMAKDEKVQCMETPLSLVLCHG